MIELVMRDIIVVVMNGLVVGLFVVVMLIVVTSRMDSVIHFVVWHLN